MKTARELLLESLEQNDSALLSFLTEDQIDMLVSVIQEYADQDAEEVEEPFEEEVEA